MVAQISLFITILFLTEIEIQLPIEAPDRKLIDFIELTDIGKFGLQRAARKAVPAHLHTGIDIKRSAGNYLNAPIFSIDRGTVISKREDGPFAQLIIEHDRGDLVYWTVYEHIAEIQVELFQQVDSNTPIARFFNTNELDQYGWQFDHFHFEILKRRPVRIKPSPDNPERLYHSFTLVCYDERELMKNFYSPIEFLSSHF